MLFTAFMMGLAGGLHCAGMCSPLVMSVTGVGTRAWINRILYNAGRVTTYGLLGMSVAVLGNLLPFSGFQNVLSLSMGILLIAFGVLNIAQMRIPFLYAQLQRVTSLIKNIFRNTLAKRHAGSIVILGMLNGLLPCGLTFIALSFCVTLPTVSLGFWFMILFGIGTLPVMIGLTTMLSLLAKRIQLPSLSRVMLIVAGGLLIARVFIMHTHHSHGSEFVDIVLCR